jgi:hypothetical protein
MAHDDRKLAEAHAALAAAFPDPNQHSFRHKKTGNVYQVLCGAVRESDLTPEVAYRRWEPVKEGTRPWVWVRPLAEFLEKFEPIPPGEKA